MTLTEQIKELYVRFKRERAIRRKARLWAKRIQEAQLKHHAEKK